MTRFLAVSAAVVGLLVAAASPAAAQWRAPARDNEHVFRRNLCSWTELKTRHVVMQQHDYSCGAAALATLIRYHLGDNVTEEQFVRQFERMATPAVYRDRVKNGLNLNDVEDLARGAGYDTLKGKLTLEKLGDSKVPLIVGITVQGYDHFVVYRGRDWEYIYLADPLRGNVRVLDFEFAGQWQGQGVLAVVRRDRDPPPTSPLTVRRSEVSLGTLNNIEVRKSLSRPTVQPPLPSRF